MNHSMTEGMVAMITTLGGTCAFIYYLFESMKKSFEQKFTHLEEKMSGLEESVAVLAEDVKDQRRRSDHLYEISNALLMKIFEDREPKKAKKETTK